MKILSSLFLALILPFCSSLWAVNNEISADGFLQYDPQEYAAPEKGGVVSQRDRREARRGGGSSGGGRSSGSKGGSYKGGSYKGGSHKGGGSKKSGHKVTSYIKSSVSRARVKIAKFMKGYSLSTSKKISVSINPLGKSARGSQPINKIESKVRFQTKESDFLYYTLRGHASLKTLFHLILIENPEDSSKLYLGYYEDNEDSVIDNTVFSSTPAPILLKDVLYKSDTSASAINGTATNSTALPPHSDLSANDTLINTNLTSRNTTGLQGLMPKGREFKSFKPILSLEKELEYSIEVAWKSEDAIASVAMSDNNGMAYTTISPSATMSSSAPSSSILSSTRRFMPDASEAIPENVGTQIVIKNKEGMTLAILNLELEPGYFSLSDGNGYLLEYRIDGAGIHQLTKIHTKNEYANENWNNVFFPVRPDNDYTALYAFLGGVAGFLVVAMLLSAFAVNHCGHPQAKTLHGTPL
ncbi:hypothetical protein [Endozoicomonas sp. ALC020]|uniref:hypothetical protein n=2 Tax=Endozoicomonas TaxID=305899 RepID=UPI003BAF67DA